MWRRIFHRKIPCHCDRYKIYSHSNYHHTPWYERWFDTSNDAEETYQFNECLQRSSIGANVVGKTLGLWRDIPGTNGASSLHLAHWDVGWELNEFNAWEQMTLDKRISIAWARGEMIGIFYKKWLWPADRLGKDHAKLWLGTHHVHEGLIHRVIGGGSAQIRVVVNGLAQSSCGGNLARRSEGGSRGHHGRK